MSQDAERPQPRGIVAAALRINDVTLSMPAPARHGDLFAALVGLGIKLSECGPVDQGFLDHRGLYLSRFTAKIVAYQFGQVSRESLEAMPELYSEDVW